MRTPTTEERLWAKVDKGSDPAACWVWKGAITTGGYGQFWFGGRLVHAHRVTFMLMVGPIPMGLELDHLCRNRSCVNPAHLEPVTRRENVLRGNGVAAINARKTHCPKGHPLTPDNLYAYSGRRCRTCARAWAKEKRSA